MGKTIIEVNELTTKHVTRFREDVYAVDHVSLKVEEGRSVGIAGESVRNSTLALSLMGYYFPPLLLQRRDHHRQEKHHGDEAGRRPQNYPGQPDFLHPQAAMNALNPTQKVINFIEDVIGHTTR